MKLISRGVSVRAFAFGNAGIQRVSTGLDSGHELRTAVPLAIGPVLNNCCSYQTVPVGTFPLSHLTEEAHPSPDMSSFVKNIRRWT